MKNPIRTALALITALIVTGLVGCEPATPEAQVAALVDAARDAAEDRSTAHLRPLLSPGFIGPESMDRETVLRFARGYLLTHRNLHVLTRVAHVSTRDGRIHAVVYAALAGQPIDSLDALSGIRARILRFTLTLEPDRGDGTRVSRAEWAQATATDMVLARWNDEG